MTGLRPRESRWDSHIGLRSGGEFWSDPTDAKNLPLPFWGEAMRLLALFAVHALGRDLLPCVYRNCVFLLLAGVPVIPANSKSLPSEKYTFSEGNIEKSADNNDAIAQLFPTPKSHRLGESGHIRIISTYISACPSLPLEGVYTSCRCLLRCWRILTTPPKLGLEQRLAPPH